MIIQIQILECKRCRHKWVPRSSKPSIECPNCKSRKWNKNKTHE